MKKKIDKNAYNLRTRDQFLVPEGALNVKIKKFILDKILTLMYVYILSYRLYQYYY